MPVFFDVDHITIRGGPDAIEWGKLYIFEGQATIQLDRSVGLSAFVGPVSLRDSIEIIRKLRLMAKEYGWKEILWERKREDGSTHTARIPIKPSRAERI